jgi:hypothetical protein
MMSWGGIPSVSGTKACGPCGILLALSSLECHEKSGIWSPFAAHSFNVHKNKESTLLLN